MATKTVTQPESPIKLRSDDKMVKVYLKQAVKKYGIWMSDFKAADDIEVFLIRSERTAKQVKMFVRIEVIMEGRCRDLDVTKVFKVG
jgi:hypothetical protein